MDSLIRVDSDASAGKPKTRKLSMYIAGIWKQEAGRGHCQSCCRCRCCFRVRAAVAVADVAFRCHWSVLINSDLILCPIKCEKRLMLGTSALRPQTPHTATHLNPPAPLYSQHVPRGTQPWALNMPQLWPLTRWGKRRFGCYVTGSHPYIAAVRFTTHDGLLWKHSLTHSPRHSLTLTHE